MCGIAGFFTPGSSQPASTLTRMMDRLRHRGPDGDGVLHVVRHEDALVTTERAERVEAALGHLRLAIVDLSPDGAEPMANEDRTLWLTFNGEIYNHAALRAELSGHIFRSRCDAEVILHGYEEHGVSFFRRMRGMYAFALLDLRREELLLCRDAFGIKPLCYAPLGQGVAFASELSALEAAGVVGEVHPPSVMKYLALGYVPAPHTIFSNAHKLMPGECLRIHVGGRERVDLREPPLPPVRRPARTWNDDDTRAVRDALDTAVREHLVSDVEVGTFLSGGVDSALVTAAMVDAQHAPVQAFTMALDDPLLDESEAATHVARALGVRHHVRKVQAEDALRRLPGILGALDEPLADPSILPTRLCAELAREHVKVALSGDGGDELFGGYSRHHLHGALAHLRKLGSAFSSAVRLAAEAPSEVLLRAYRSAPSSLGLPPLTAPERKLRAAARGLGEPAPLEYGRLFRAGLPEELSAFSSTDPVEDHLRRLAAGYEVADPLSLAQAMDLRGHLHDDILTKVDRASMGVALEARVPLLSDVVGEAAAGLPTEALRRRTEGKRVLRALLAERLGDAVANAPKRGFSLPLSRWLSGPLAGWRRDALGSLASRDLLPAHALTQVERAHDDGEDHGPLLFALCALEMWLRARPGR
ncbi:MAG: asparagine synthase (glutamine-hydrolyzing) [Myxococcota bacterium]